MSPRWHGALSYALTGTELPLPEPGRPDAPAVLAALADAGWPPERIAARARAMLQQGDVWPHPVPADLRAGCGAAQLHAALAAARELIGLTTLETRPPSLRRRLDADEQRLMREVPPHHVA